EGTEQGQWVLPENLAAMTPEAETGLEDDTTLHVAIEDGSNAISISEGAEARAAFVESGSGEEIEQIHTGGEPMIVSQPINNQSPK
ncbi:hypothetical protein PMAYCL1PPCAC_08175, partial [Pristionchus mayeri]